MSSNDNQIPAETRTSFGKGAARKLRAVGKVPAVLYGHGSEPQHLSLPGHEFMLLVRRANAILDLQLESGSQLALVKDVQRDPVRQIIEHADLIIVKRGEKVTVDVPVHLEGETAPGTIANQESNTLQIEVEALHIPNSIVVSIEGLEEGHQILAGDVELPTGATLLTDPETLVAGVLIPAATEAAEDDEAAEGDEAAAAEGDEPAED